MSLLNPVLLPPNVKAYLSQGERFIKWDDVSRDRPWEWPVLGSSGAWAGGLVYVSQHPGAYVAWLGSWHTAR